jgi:hypothetical protein
VAGGTISNRARQGKGRIFQTERCYWHKRVAGADPAPEDTIEGNLLKLARLAGRSGHNGLINAIVLALYQPWKTCGTQSIDPETLAMTGRLSAKAVEPAH